MNWATEEMENVDLGDKRLNRRAASLLDTLSMKPDSSIPATTKGLAEMTAAYRLFDNPAVDEQKLLEPHYQRTRERMREERVVLCIEDTTQLDYTTQVATTGLGPLYRSFQRGMFLHPMLAVTPSRSCLGLLGAKFYVRDIPDDEEKGPEEEKAERKKKAERLIEEKESYRWLDGYLSMNELAKSTSSTLIYCADRESDIDELLTASQGQPGKLLIRARHDRRIDEDERMWNSVYESPILGYQEFDMEARPGRRARKVRQALHSKSVTFPPNKKRDNPITVTVIIAHEEHPPEGEEAVSWTLITTLDVATVDDVKMIVDFYRCRWEIECYFKVLKSGCAVEKLQLQTVKRLKAATALYLIIAYRVLYMTKAGRETPNIPCDAVFDEEEWKTAYSFITGNSPPKKVPRLLEMIIMVAKIGGFIGRKGDGFPGPKTLWLGLSEIRIYLCIHYRMSEVAKTGKRYVE